MGGDGHGHGHGHAAPKWAPPDWRLYKVQGVPRAEEHVQRLAALGLKDPWVRNEVWRYHPEFHRSPLQWMGWLVTRGARIGGGAFFVYFIYDRVIAPKFQHKEHHAEHH